MPLQIAHTHTLALQESLRGSPLLTAAAKLAETEVRGGACRRRASLRISPRDPPVLAAPRTPESAGGARTRACGFLPACTLPAVRKRLLPHLLTSGEPPPPPPGASHPASHHRPRQQEGGQADHEAAGAHAGQDHARRAAGGGGAAHPTGGPRGLEWGPGFEGCRATLRWVQGAGLLLGSQGWGTAPPAAPMLRVLALASGLLLGCMGDAFAWPCLPALGWAVCAAVHRCRGRGRACPPIYCPLPEPLAPSLASCPCAGDGHARHGHLHCGEPQVPDPHGL